MADDALLLGAGVLAGVVGTAGGITLVDLLPRTAVGRHTGVAGEYDKHRRGGGMLPGSAMSSRPELRGKGPWLLRWALVAATGGGIGARCC